MRRVLSSAMLASGLVGVIIGAGPGHAAPAHAAPALAPLKGAQAAPPKKVCTIKDQRLREVSGMIATAKGYIVINDSTDAPANKPVFFLDAKCNFVDNVPFPTAPLDPEDLALSPDGKTLWIADIGDNPSPEGRRTRVALWSMPANGSAKPVIHRVGYPEGTHHDAEALIIADDGTPIIVTKTTGKAQLFTPSAPLKKNNETPVPMQKVGEISLPKTTTANPIGAIGRLTVTGAARSPDGKRVTLRTYADAFEWEVAGGDIVKAVTTSKPRVTPLADAFGEAIAYTPDGKAFVTVSDLRSLPNEQVVIQRYQPATTYADEAAAAAGGPKASGRSWTDNLSLQDINYLIGSVGVIGAILVGVGIFGILRARRKPPAGSEDGRKGSAAGAVGRQEHQGYPEPGWDAGGYEPGANGQSPGVYGSGTAAKRAGAVYGGGAAAKPGGVYGGTPGGGATRGEGVYGGAPKAGGVYGGGGGTRRASHSGGGVYGGQPSNGANGGGDRDEDYRHGGRGGGYRSGGRRDDDGYDDSWAGYA